MKRKRKPIPIIIKNCQECNEEYECNYHTSKFCNKCKKVRKKRSMKEYLERIKNQRRNNLNTNTNTFNPDHYSYMKGIFIRGRINEIDIYKIIDIYSDYFEVNRKTSKYNINQILDRFCDKFDKKDKKIVKINKNGFKV